MRVILRRLFLICMLFLALVSYARWIEPFWIEVTHHIIAANVKSPLKIAHLTDLHIHKIGYREKRLLKLLSQESPDVRLVKGYWENWRPSENEQKVYADARVHFLNNENAQVKHVR